MPRPHLALLLPALLCPGLARATDFVVTSTADSGSGTLREAIEEANDDEGGAPHRITFDLGDTATIALESALDYLEHATTIDGIDGHPSASCQPRGTPHQLAVQIRAVPDSQLGVIRTLAPLTVRGLALVGYDDEGIILEGAAHGSSVQCSYFGMQLDGVTAEGSQGNDSIDIVEEDDILPTDVVIGTDGDGVDDDREWNLFVATDRAIRLKGPEPDGNLTGGTGVVIAGNLFGLAATGQAPPVDPKTGEPALGIQGDVIRVDGPYRGVQIGQPCTGGSPEQANVFGWFGDDALDIDGIDLGADELCFAGNQVHLTLGEELVGDHVAGSGIELDGGHYGLQVVSNRFARLTYGVRIDGADTFDQGIAPYAVQIDDNLFGDPNHPDRAVRRAVELSLVTGADITANAAYGGLEAEGYPSLAGAGANLSGSHATIEGNTFSGLTSAIRLLPEYHNVDPQSEMLGPDDILAVASITARTTCICQPGAIICFARPLRSNRGDSTTADKANRAHALSTGEYP